MDVPTFRTVLKVTMTREYPQNEALLLMPAYFYSQCGSFGTSLKL